MPFVKLDCKILDKSIWRESPETKIVWITILAMADSDGLVEASIPGIADRAKVSLKETEKAINTFQEPDKWSSSQDHEGRRIERVNGGFQILNYQQYRDKDYTAAARVKRYRECLRVTGVTKRSEYIYASEVLDYLNLKTGRKYRNFKNILPRLREGRTVEEMKKVIDTKLLDPYFIENPQYMNPETLFRPGNFDRYINQRPDDFNGNGKSKTFGPMRHVELVSDNHKSRKEILIEKIAFYESQDLDEPSKKKLAGWKKELAEIGADEK